MRIVTPEESHGACMTNTSNDDTDVYLNFPDKCSGGSVSGEDIKIFVDLCGSHLAMLHAQVINIKMEDVYNHYLGYISFSEVRE